MQNMVQICTADSRFQAQDFEVESDLSAATVDCPLQFVIAAPPSQWAVAWVQCPQFL